MSDYEKLNKIRKMANEMSYQAMDDEYQNDEEKLKRALDYVSRSLGMLAEVEMDRTKGSNESNEILNFIEMRVELALQQIMNPTKDNQQLDKPEPYVLKDLNEENG
ncbi:hypothetical protein [Qipengyuania zhejiangensis]|uniref:hypothetical protein n=1 Tax=Qipengyuania zhejiangensis TaxID=3077782 RepID=UPI002D78BA75|nr:hypothetical protein [Qipengyuania sp. Z2]